jgi:hypothetical protein
MARGTNIKWIQTAGGWTSAKMLLDVYGHYLSTESAGFADALTGPPRSADGTHTAPGRSRAAAIKSPRIARAWSSSERMEPTIRVERTTCAPLRGSTRFEARARFAAPPNDAGVQRLTALNPCLLPGADDPSRTDDLRAASRLHSI